MPSLIEQLDGAFRAAIVAAFGAESDPLISVSQNDKFGDFQANAAMGLAKTLSESTGQKTHPRAVAQKILDHLDLTGVASETSIAGPGFINVRIRADHLAGELAKAAADPRLGVPPAASALRVVVDYSGPNIAKEMHVGHLRSTIIGDALARTLSFLGHEVIRQNHVGDWGLQMGMVTYAMETTADSEELTLGGLETLYKRISRATEDPAVRRQMAERTRELQRADKSDLPNWKRVRDLTLAAAHAMYRRLDVLLTEADVRGESDYADRYRDLIDRLVASGHAMETAGALGLFPPGFTNKEGEPRPFLIQSRDGTYQYPTFDLAALEYRVKTLGARRLIYTHDARQAEHFAMLFAVAGLLGWDRTDGGAVSFEYAPFGTMLGEDGKPYKTRSGETVKLAALLDEAEQRARAVVDEKNPEMPEEQRRAVAHSVGIGAVKYADLSKDRISDYVFSWDRMLSMEGNTAPYLQYAHARVRSIFRRAGERGIEATGSGFVLDSPQELALAKHLLRFGDVVAAVARELKPHHLCNYLYELSSRFSGFFENCPVLQSEDPARSSRLRLCELTARTLASGLDLLGIGHPEQL